MMTQPNILLICADQLRWDFLGCYGAEWMNTPNIDRIAKQGMRFPVCVTNSPICVPARVGLATGRLPATIGVLDNAYFLDPTLTTYYQRLRDAGYRVGCCGKLDLAKKDHYNGRDGKRPRTFQWGFTDPVEIEGKGHCLGKPEPRGPYGFWLQAQGLYDAYHQERMSLGKEGRWYKPSQLPTETFLDVYQGSRAVEWLETMPDDSPWHLFVSFSGPHAPHDPPQDYVDRFHGAAIPDPIPKPEDERANVAYYQAGGTPVDPDTIRAAREAYCGYIELIDEQVGRIIEALEKRPDASETYIFFTSDHGEQLGDLGHWEKRDPYEASIRVPLICSGPGIPAGTANPALIELMDINPTICDLAGLPPQANIDAQSFAGCLRDGNREHRAEVVSAMRMWWCMRTKRYKLINSWNEVSELYDLQKDPGEQQNIFADMEKQNPQLLADLHQRLNRRFWPNPYHQHRA